MDPIRRPSPFCLLSTGHGSLIVNRNDQQLYVKDGEPHGYGVGLQLFQSSLFDPDEVEIALNLLDLRRTHFGDGVVALDCGANIGVHTIEWARRMTGWGTVIGFEAQERVYYALAGNVALNNCFNARVLHAAIGGEVGEINVPNLDYNQETSFGSFELRKLAKTEYIGQAVDYEAGPTTPVNMFTIDALQCKRLDFIKLDIEGMEMEALTGAADSIAAHRPQIMVEFIKSDREAIHDFLLERGYLCFDLGINILAVHRDDPSHASVHSTAP